MHSTDKVHVSRDSRFIGVITRYRGVIAARKSKREKNYIFLRVEHEVSYTGHDGVKPARI